VSSRLLSPSLSWLHWLYAAPPCPKVVIRLIPSLSHYLSSYFYYSISSLLKCMNRTPENTWQSPWKLLYVCFPDSDWKEGGFMSTNLHRIVDVPAQIFHAICWPCMFPLLLYILSLSCHFLISLCNYCLRCGLPTSCHCFWVLYIIPFFAFSPRALHTFSLYCRRVYFPVSVPCNVSIPGDVFPAIIQLSLCANLFVYLHCNQLYCCIMSLSSPYLSILRL
jgi:hypothetical protein